MKNCKVCNCTIEICEEDYCSDECKKELSYIHQIAELKHMNKKLTKALEEIAEEKEIHTKLNQERLCCKFQGIAMEALGVGC